MVTPICPVRGCGSPLAWTGPIHCSNGHHFDRARSGYTNLLQPQDKKSATPGDSADAARARRRIVDRGLQSGILDAILDVVPAGRRAIDLGCGEGYVVGGLAARGDEAWGVDISAAAVDLAARRHPAAHWVVANADRALPFAAGAFDVALSVTGRKNPPETRRLLAPGGRAIVVLSGERDLAELREVIHGHAEPVERVAATIAAFAGFTCVDQLELERTFSLDRDALADLLLLTYRGGRRREQERFAAIERLDVTFHHRVLVLTA